MLKYLIGDKRIVPVVMFHSVGLQYAKDWSFHYISEPIENFEDKIRCLKKAGYRFIFWRDLFLYMSGRKKISLPAVMLTFDDGYLDNWLYVYPILKKYEAKGTIFVNPEFVDPSRDVRKISNGDPLANPHPEASQFPDRGFLNWEEMRCMESSGLIDIQSHAMTHTWYFSGPKLVDFHAPGYNKFPWLAWNEYPESKPYYMRADHSSSVPFGSPVYAYEKALICQRYFPPTEVAKSITRFIEDTGGESFFYKKDWKNILSEKHRFYFDKYRSLGFFESKKDYETRIFNELEQSKKIIERELEKTVDYICWPGGGYNQKVISVAKNVGYKSWTLGSRDNSSFRNTYCVNPENIKRIGSYTKVKIKNTSLGFASGRDLIISIKRHQNSLFYRYYDYCNKISKIIN